MFGNPIIEDIKIGRSKGIKIKNAKKKSSIISYGFEELQAENNNEIAKDINLLTNLTTSWAVEHYSLDIKT